MRIAYVISSINSKSNGLGGHYHSLIQTAEQINRKHDVIIINIGNQPAKALEGLEIKTYFLIYNGPAITRIYKELKKIITKEKLNILHAFDASSYFWTRLVGNRLKIPNCLTKCGGINQIYFPYAKNLILYSSENLEHFKNKRKFKNCRLYLIPNRIKQFQNDESRIQKIYNNIGEYKESFKFLRISRIGNYYFESSLQLINLIRRLTADNVKCCAIFIGTVEDKICFSKLNEIAPTNCFFFTEEEYTKNAKSILSSTDAVLGTGRSFMEAAAKEKILLCPVNNGQIPAVVTNKNFKDAFFYNFSERIKFNNYNEEDNYLLIKSIINDKGKLEEQQLFSRKIFNDFFNAEEVLEKYEDIYTKLQYQGSERILDFFLNAMFLIRNYYR